VDTLHFYNYLQLTGARSLWTAPFLHQNPSAIHGVPPAPTLQAFSDVPDVYALYQNYPNPFNPATTIRFDLPEPALVTLKVYNILGQEVATLLDRELLMDDTHEVEFDAEHLASGVYFYKISAEAAGADEAEVSAKTFQSIMKMLLIK
jgi:hypothetical protein